MNSTNVQTMKSMYNNTATVSLTVQNTYFMKDHEKPINDSANDVVS